MRVFQNPRFLGGIDLDSESYSDFVLMQPTLLGVEGYSAYKCPTVMHTVLFTYCQ